MPIVVRTPVTGLPDPACQRARCVVSLLADGEATELERAFLDSHLVDCPACAAYAGGVEEATSALRAAPLDSPQFVVRLPARRRLSSRPVQMAAAAIVLVGAGLAGLSGLPQRELDNGPTGTAVALGSAAYEQHVIRTARRWPPDGVRTRPAAVRAVSLGAHAQPLPR
jgi:predicted anti-sigma-YlaC factor YlaD